MAVRNLCSFSMLFLLFLTFTYAKKKLPRVKFQTLKRADDCEQKVKMGYIVFIHYKASLSNGTVFDSTWERQKPHEVHMGAGEILKGLEIGLKGMCKGEKRRIDVPPHLAYGEKGLGTQVPPNEWITYEVDYYGSKPAELPDNVFKRIDANRDRRLSRTEVEYFMKEFKELPPEYKTMEAYVDFVFAQEDKDEDGYISFHEFNGPKYDKDEL